MLQNAGVTAFTVSELLKENQHERGGRGSKITLTQIRVKGDHTQRRSASKIYVVNVFFWLMMHYLTWIIPKSFTSVEDSKIKILKKT